MMRYKVYDTVKHKYVTDGADFVLEPNGRFAINECGDTIEVEDCIVQFYPTDSDGFFIDEIGGTHIDGRGYLPDGMYCGACDEKSCSLCAIWQSIRGKST